MLWRCNGRVVEAVDEVLWRCKRGGVLVAVDEMLWRCKSGGAICSLHVSCVCPPSKGSKEQHSVSIIFFSCIEAIDPSLLYIYIDIICQSLSRYKLSRPMEYLRQAVRSIIFVLTKTIYE